MSFDPWAKNKREFARQWFLTGSPKIAAHRVFPDDWKDGQRRMTAIGEWVHDPLVAKLVSEFQEETQETSEYPVPTKTELVHTIMVQSAEFDPEAKIKGWRLMAEMLGYIEKPSTNITNVQQSIDRVMEVQVFGSNADWERQCEAQQAKLIEAARA